MGFIDEQAKWLKEHSRKRSGERKSRLERGHEHGERKFLECVWWPLFGNFDDLHPEYEVADWRGHSYFVDFAWLRGSCKFAIEIKGYGPHVQNADRIRYRRELDRELFLQVLGYRVAAIPYDDLEEQPTLTQMLMKSLLTPYMHDSPNEKYSCLERDVLLLGLSSNKPIRPIDVAEAFRINQRTAVKCLEVLCSKGRFRPLVAGRGIRIVSYEFVRTASDGWMW